MDFSVHIRRVIERLGEKDANGLGVMIFTPASDGVARRFIGLFLAPQQTIDLGQLGFHTNATEIWAMAADLPGLAVNDLIERAGVRYRVRKTPDEDLLGGFIRLVIGEPRTGGPLQLGDGGLLVLDDGGTLELP